jgi:hypothetical protein
MISIFALVFRYPPPNLPRQRGRNRNPLPVDGEGRGGVRNVEISTQRRLPIATPKFEKMAVDNPLLKVPPAPKGNLKEGGQI